MKTRNSNLLTVLGWISGVIAAFNLLGLIIMTLQFSGWPTRDTKDIAFVSEAVLQNLRSLYLSHLLLSITMSGLAALFFILARRQQRHVAVADR